MTTLNELKAQLTAIQEAITKLETVEKESELPWGFKPVFEAKYYFVTQEGIIDSAEYGNGTFWEGCYETGNCFKTREQAKKELETRKVIAELRLCEGVKKFVPNNNFCIEVDLEDFCIDFDYVYSHLQGFAQVYFESEQSVQNAIDKVGKDRILAAAKWLARGE